MKTRCALNLMLLAVLTALALSTHAQTFQVLHTFEGTDGLGPGALTLDAAGNLYGATWEGGIQNCPVPNNAGCGTLFALSRNSNWAFKTLYRFQSSSDGWSPNSP